MRLQELARVGPVGGSLIIHVRLDRQADEQRQLVRIVVGQLDPHRQPLHDLHEVAGRVLRRQQGERLAGAHREAGDPALELVLAAVHVDFAHAPRCPIRRSASCVSLKLASIQISVSERTAIKLWPACTLLPGFTLRRVTTPSISLTTLQYAGSAPPAPDRAGPAAASPRPA